MFLSRYYYKLKSLVRSIPLYREIYIYFEEKDRFLTEARKRFDKEKPKYGSYKDYLQAFKKNRVTYSEYMFSYKYWNLDEKGRDAFISTSEMQCIYRKLGDKEVREVFHDKVRFLSLFEHFVHRWWSMARTLNFEEFKSKVNEYDLIAKPIDGTRGNGIFKISSQTIIDWKELYDKLVKNNYLLEQCISEYKDLADFHPSSLNTIRVVTISNNDKCEVFGALMRMGAHGSIIDNTHAGGVYAPINVSTGIIEVPAIDSHNNYYDNHPDTGKSIKGYQIPQWNQIMDACKDATRVIPNIHFAGWDVCLNNDGTVEIIEGNHAPDFDGGMQAPLKIGVKKRLQQTVIDVMGIDPLPLISVWKY